MDEILQAFRDGIPGMAEVRSAIDKENASGRGPVTSFTVRWQPETSVRLRHGALPAFSGAGTVSGASMSVIMTGFEFPFLLRLPPGHRPGRPCPALLFLHGIGERGADPAVLTDQGPFRFVSAGNELPFILIAPQLEKGRHWTEDASGRPSDTQMMRLAGFLRQVSEAYDIDPCRLYLTGLSMGGRGALRLACFLPRAFAAAAVCCGRASERTDPDRMLYPIDGMKDLPLWLFHGTEDDIVLPEHSLSVLRQLTDLEPRTDRRLTMYPGVKHGCFDHAYLERELYDWFVCHDIKTPVRCPAGMSPGRR